MMRWRSLLQRAANGAGFYIGWLVCMWGAAKGCVLQATAITAGIVLLHFFLSQSRLKDLLMLAAICFLGLVIDGLYSQMEIIAYASPNPLYPFLAPFWIVAIYALFAISVDHSLSWLRNRPLLAALMGMLGGVFSYQAGVRLGAITFLLPPPWTLVLLACVWALLTPAVCTFSDWLDKCVANKSNAH